MIVGEREGAVHPPMRDDHRTKWTKRMGRRSEIYIYIFEICFKWLERYYILSSGGKITMVLFEMELVQVKNGMAGAIYNSQLRRSAVDLDDIRH